MYNILVCDDEKDIVSALSIYLKSDGYQVYKAYNGKEALELVQKGDIHLAVSYTHLDVYKRQVHSFEDLKELADLGSNHLNVTIGSALDIFGGMMPYQKVLQEISDLNKKL